MDQSMDKLMNILDEIKPGEDFTRTDLISGGVLKSFDMMLLIQEINDAFDVQIPLEDIIPENFESAAQIMTTIRKQL
ncbi:MAG: acyl carrier protein [Bilifractor sp.]|jgi:D-alanine--poly(phosphoribitol) ligase subunit 2